MEINIKIGNVKVTIVRPELTDDEKTIRENAVIQAIKNYMKEDFK